MTVPYGGGGGGGDGGEREGGGGDGGEGGGEGEGSVCERGDKLVHCKQIGLRVFRTSKAGWRVIPHALVFSRRAVCKHNGGPPIFAKLFGLLELRKHSRKRLSSLLAHDEDADRHSHAASIHSDECANWEAILVQAEGSVHGDGPVVAILVRPLNHGWRGNDDERVTLLGKISKQKHALQLVVTLFLPLHMRTTSKHATEKKERKINRDIHTCLATQSNSTLHDYTKVRVQQWNMRVMY